MRTLSFFSWKTLGNFIPTKLFPESVPDQETALGLFFRPADTGNSPSVPKDSPLACFKIFFKQLGLKLDVDLGPNIPLTTKTAGLNLSGSNQPSCRTSTEMGAVKWQIEGAQTQAARLAQ